MRPHIDYGDLIGTTFQWTFGEKLESVQYNAVLATTSTIQGASRENLFTELGLESLTWQDGSVTNYCMFRIIKNQAQKYLNILQNSINYIFQNTIVEKGPLNLPLCLSLLKSDSTLIRVYHRIQAKTIASFVRKQQLLTSSIQKDWNYLPAYYLVLVI